MLQHKAAGILIYNQEFVLKKSHTSCLLHVCQALGLGPLRDIYSMAHNYAFNHGFCVNNGQKTY